MTHRLSNNQQAPQDPATQKDSSLENGGQGVDEHLAGFLESLSDAFVCLDRQWRVTYINHQDELLLQQPGETLLGKMLWEAFPEAVGSTFYCQYHEAVETDTAVHFEEFSPSLNKWFEVHAYPSENGIAVSCQDITQHKRVEKELFTLAAIVESSDDAIFSKTLDGLVLSWNTGAERLYGYSAQEMIGQLIHTLVPPERRQELAAIMQRLTAGQRIEHFETVRRRKDGGLIDVSITISPIKDATGEILGASTIARDITERKQMQERQRMLNEANNVLLSSLDHQITLQEIAHLLVPAFADYCRIALVDEQQQIKEIAMNHIDPEKIALVAALYERYKDRARATYGLQKILQTGQPELISNVSESVGEAIQVLPELLTIIKTLGLQSYMGVPLLARGKTIGAIIFSSVQLHRYYTPDDLSFAQELAHRITLVLENARLHREAQAEIAERKQAEERQRVLQERILALATTDPVTALSNHRGLIARLDPELERAHRYERPCSLLVLDLDHFKALNDGYGHTVGDAVLCEVADLVQTQLRGMDTVGRWGGEEFVVIQPELQAEGALHLANAVRTAVATHTFRVSGGLHLTCSVGLASYPMHAQEREGLLHAADQAMYGAKRFGRNQVRVANDPAILALFTTSHPEGGREEAALVGMAEALVTLVEARDQLTGHHAQQVADLVLQLALALGASVAEAQMIALAGRLHDIGKVAVPDTVLLKPGVLTEEEWKLMRTHPVVGADVVSHIPALRPLAPVIRAHHERWDGQGYPDHLAGDAIPFGARILMVADAYLAMIADRPYRKACAPSTALAELRRCAKSQFDPQVVEALTLLLRHSAKAATQHA